MWHWKTLGVEASSCAAYNLVLKNAFDVSLQLSLKSLAFDALITPDKESGLSRLQSVCIDGDVETFTAIQNNSPSKLDSVIALNVKIKSSSLHFPGKSLWTVLMLHKSSRHKQILKLVETICSEFRSQSLIHVTAREGKVHHLRRLLDCGEKLNTKENDWLGEGPFPVMLAAKCNDEEVFEFLIERGNSLAWVDDQRRTSVHYAAEGGKVRNLLRLIERGVNVLQKDRKGYSALHLAALNGHTDCVRLLIEHGADVNEFTHPYDSNGFSRDPFTDDFSRPYDIPGYTPLMLAAEKGHLQTVQVLLENGGELNRGNEMAWLPLHSAVSRNHTELVKFLLKLDANVLASTVHGTTVLHLATCLELVMILVERGANIQANDICGRTPLHVAAEMGKADTVNYLLDRGADVNARDKDGLLALYCALKGGHVTTAKFLIDKGSEPLLSSDPSLLGFYEADLLQSSAREGLTATVEFLLSSGVSADVIHSESASLLTPLEEAASAGHCDVVRLLLHHGANINGNVASREERLRKRQMESNSWEDRHFWGNICPLYAAVRAGQGEVAKLLIEAGANVSPLNSGTFRALSDLAAKYGLFDVLQLLEKLDAIEDFRLKNGDTILTSAVRRMDFELVSHLLRNGVNVNTKNEDGNSALHLLFRKQTSMEMFKLLLSFGADINALNNRFESPLLCAIDCEEEKIISLLLELDCAVNTEAPLGESPLSLAVIKGQHKLTEALLQCDADVNQKCGRDEHTALHAAVHGHFLNGIAQLLVQHGADLEAKDRLGETPLFKAATKNKLAEFFLKCGSAANTKNKFGETPLMKALEQSAASIVRTLLEHGASINATDQHRVYPLLHCVRFIDVEICELLLEYGCDVNITDDNGETPLHQLAWGPDIVKMLLDKGAHVGALDRENRTPLHAASYQGHPSSIELLIHHGADINSTDNHGWTPLHFAAAGENYDALEVLIQNGSDIAAVDKTGRTALHLAARKGCLSPVKLLIDRGSNINLKDYRGRTLLGATFKLDYSPDFYYLDFVKYYMEHGGDKFAVDDETGRSILHFAAGHQFVSTVDDLLDHGLDLEARDKNGETPLHRAVASGTEEIIQHLVNRGADVCAVNKRGQTPLHVSLVHHRSNFLLKLKPDFQKPDKYGNTPLHLAIYNPRTSSMFNDPSAFSVDDVRILLNAGGDIRSRDKQGNTPLHIAAAEVRYDIVELLIKEGSSVNARNVQGRTCLHMASCSGAQDIVQMLFAHGAEVNVEDEKGCTPLHNALSFHYYWLVEPFLKHGSNPNAVDYKGSTPLHVGCSYNDAYDFLYPNPADTEPSWYSAFQDEWVSIMISHGR